MGIDPEGVFRSGQLRICALCLGDIDRDDQCTYVEDEISCMDCAYAADLAEEDWENEGGAADVPVAAEDLDDFSYDYDYDY